MLELLQDIFNIYLCLQRFKECYKNEKRFIHKIINKSLQEGVWFYEF